MVKLTLIFLGFKGIFAQFMTMWEKKILARAIGIQKGIGRFQKISEGEGGSRLWNAEGMGGNMYLRLDIRRHW